MYCFSALLCSRNDDELNKLFGDVTIAQGGVIPHIHQVLIPKGSKAASTEGAAAPDTPASPAKAKKTAKKET
ncbi:hypothetical protein EON64_11650 [archaeon]|nr:MAG: hypothetical protein EON64_11650 [archaeon]